jgi:tetratricopeptide (TPR) repeat protein
MKAYCSRTARAYRPRWTLAEFERDAGNREAELRYLVECNRIDPFDRELHVRLGEAYEALDRQAQAALEYEVAAAVTPQQDRAYLGRDEERPDPDGGVEREARGELWLRAAKLRHRLGDHERAAELLERTIREASGTSAADAALELQPEWRRR